MPADLVALFHDAGFARVCFLAPFVVEPDPHISENYRGGAPCIAVAALPYGNQFENTNEAAFRGPFAVTDNTKYQTVIAPFAQRNYYREAVRRLQSIIPTLRRQYGGVKSDYRILCNSPVNEKRLALRSGLGWQGKNTLILTKESGSLLVIACLTLPFVPPPACGADDAVYNGACNSCNACVRACPTGALDNNGKLAREKCIQWYASGHGESVPDIVRARWGQVLYGCTVCQDVCPWNRKPIAGLTGAEYDNGILPAALDAEKILAASDDAIKTYFKGTAMGLNWLGPAAIKRSAALSLSVLF
jgi:epoxyqueuosine reductase